MVDTQVQVGHLYLVRHVMNKGQPVDDLDLDVARAFDWSDDPEHPRIKLEFFGTDENGQLGDYEIIAELYLVEVDDDE